MSQPQQQGSLLGGAPFISPSSVGTSSDSTSVPTTQSVFGAPSPLITLPPPPQQQAGVGGVKGVVNTSSAPSPGLGRGATVGGGGGGDIFGMGSSGPSWPMQSTPSVPPGVQTTPPMGVAQPDPLSALDSLKVPLGSIKPGEN